MIEIGRVLCPVDFSEFSRRALDHAIAVARWYRSQLTVLYVHRLEIPEIAQFVGLGTASIESRLLSPSDRELIRDQLRAMVRPEAVRDIPVTCEVTEGEVVSEILAAGDSADLIVLGTHGRSGFERFVLGSVTEKVMRRAKIPILTVPIALPGATHDTVPALFHQILAGVDFSEPSMTALAFALSLAEEADAHLTLLHVTEIPRALQRWADEDPEGKRYIEQWRAYALEQLRPIVPDAAQVYCHVDARVETGQPYRAILGVASEQRVGLIVLGRHSQHAVERAFIGSTAQHVIREAGCPVLTVPAPSSKRGEKQAPDHGKAA